MDAPPPEEQLRFSGVLDGRRADEVRSGVYGALARCERVVLDLTGVELVDLTVMRMLAVASREAERRGRRLVLRGAQGPVRRLARLSGTGRWLRMETPEHRAAVR